MKIDKEEFELMREKYALEVGSGMPGMNSLTIITDQTKWIFFDRESLERVLAQANPDPKKGGIKFHFAEYTQEVAEKHHPQDSNSYVGRLTLAFEAADKDNLNQDSGTDFENIGGICPPDCQ